MQDDDFIPLSALQHYMYCPRQCALIHIEQMWSENVYTAEGRLLHQRADASGIQMRHGVRTATAMPLHHVTLGIAGFADVVEFHSREDGGIQAVPIEYKRGRPKKHRADEVQLCAQALCLEDMLGHAVPYGMLFYGKTRRRKTVPFDTALRQLTHQVIDETRAMLAAGHTPSARYDAARCDACSLIEDCRPHWLTPGHSVTQWLAGQLTSTD